MNTTGSESMSNATALVVFFFHTSPNGVDSLAATAPAAFVAGARLFAGGGPEIGNDYILVPRTNADGAPVVRMYRIHKERM
jgi:hypothetical protein